MDLDQPVKNAAVLSWYGIDSPDQVLGIHSSSGWFSQLGTGVYWQQTRVAQCKKSGFVAAFSSNSQMIIACKEQLFVLDAQGEIEEKLDSLFGLPVPISALASNASGEVFIQIAAQHGSAETYKLNLDSAQWTRVNESQSRTWLALQPLPEPLENALLEQYRGSDLNWERVLLDLHSGRLFGVIGNWLMDFVAICILVLAASGLRLWWARPARK